MNNNKMEKLLLMKETFYDFQNVFHADIQMIVIVGMCVSFARSPRGWL